MLSSIILFVTAVLGFLCTVLILRVKNYLEYSLVNKYLLIVFVANSMRFLAFGMAELTTNTDVFVFAQVLDVIVLMLMPCFYLYFLNIIYENKFEMSNLMHFIVPFILGCLYISTVFTNLYFAHLIQKLFFFSVILFYIIYAISGFFLLNKHIWKRKTYIKIIQKQNDLIKNWSIFLYISFMIIILIRIATGIILNNSTTFSNQYVWIPALVWSSIFINIILTPEILYGYNLLNKHIGAATDNLVLHNVWNKEGIPQPITSEKDEKLRKKIKPLLDTYLQQIEAFSFHTHAFRNPDLSATHIAIALNLPVSYIHYIIKFHCNETFTDYKKIVRIYDATKLLEQGYLIDQKTESLAAAVGFTSYNTFSIAFKNIIGVTTQDYIKRF